MTGATVYRQLGIVVKDIERAMRHWSETLGAGPFLLLRNRVFEDYTYRGVPRRRRSSRLP